LNMPSTTPLLPHAEEAAGAEKQQRGVTGLGGLLQEVLAVGVAVLITLLDNFPYGFLLFPMQASLHGLGISMVLLSAAVAQLVFAISSDLPMGLGCMIVENIPMLHSMALSVTNTLNVMDLEDMIVPTVLALYVTASLLSAVAFFLLGHFHMDQLFATLPKPVLLGCIGGMGIYILTAGVGSTTDVAWAWTTECLQHQFLQWRKVLLLCALECLLRAVVQLSKRHAQSLEPFVLPCFFLGLIPAAWLFMLLSGQTHQEAQASGVLFSVLPPTEGLATQWKLLHVDRIAWWVFPDQILLLLGIAVFSCLHVPVNVPGLGLTTKRNVDISKELKAHSIANFVAAALGTVQNYMVYSSSVLYFQCGGRSRMASVAVGVCVIGCIPYATLLIPFLPRVLAGVLLMHLGLELVKESFIDTWHSLDLLEYAIVVCIAGICNVSFMGGFLVGLICACVAFAVQAARCDPVESAFFPGRGMRSSTMRNQSELKRLETFEQENGFCVLRLHGTLFFGNTHTLAKQMEDVCCKSVILDVHHVVAIDSSGFSQLDNMAGALQTRGVDLLCSGFLAQLLPKAQQHPHLGAALFFLSMNDAVKSLEDQALQQVAATTTYRADVERKLNFASKRSTASPSEEDCVFFEDTCRRLLEPLGLADLSAPLRNYFNFQTAELEMYCGTLAMQLTLLSCWCVGTWECLTSIEALNVTRRSHTTLWNQAYLGNFLVN